MLDHSNAIRYGGLQSKAVLRIAVPAWAPSFGKSATTTTTEKRAPTREEFKRLLDAALNPSDRMLRRMTRRERQQIAITRKLRSALYGTRDWA